MRYQSELNSFCKKLEQKMLEMFIFKKEEMWISHLYPREEIVDVVRRLKICKVNSPQMDK
jgi:hypothetical protein